MSKSNWQKSMSNTSLSDRTRSSTGYKSKDRNWVFEVNLSIQDKNRLKKFMFHELEYYNFLVNAFSGRCKAFPNTIIEVTDKLELAFGAVAETAYKAIYNNILKDDVELPEELEPFRKVIFGKDEKGNRRITERFALILEDVAYQAPIHPTVRKNMALEMLEFYRKQARVHLQAVPKSMTDEMAFKTAPESLEVLDPIRKRHLQFPKSTVKVKWDEKNEKSLFYIPYLSTPIEVPTLNFQEDEKTWNYMIIKQAAQGIPDSRSPWILEVKTTPLKYMLKYLDTRSPNGGAAFFQAKRGLIRH